MQKAKGKKTLRVIFIILGVIALLIVLVIVKAVHDSKLRAEDQQMMVKSDEALIGEHLYIHRDGADDVDVNLYRGESDIPQPLVINVHGGAAAPQGGRDCPRTNSLLSFYQRHSGAA